MGELGGMCMHMDDAKMDSVYKWITNVVGHQERAEEEETTTETIEERTKFYTTRVQALQYNMQRWRF